MKSKRLEASELTRQRISDAAMALFQEKGFDGTTMRDIATSAGVALGATYHHFDSKDDIVMVFYRNLLQQETQWLELPGYRDSDKLEDRIRFLILKKLEQLTPLRLALEGVFHKASNPKSPLSPFSQETRQIREGNVALFQKALDTSKHSLHAELLPLMPKVLWLYQMAMIQTWFYDRSPLQERSLALIQISLPLMLRGLETLSMPFMGSFRSSAIALIQLIDKIMEEPAT